MGISKEVILSESLSRGRMSAAKSESSSIAMTLVFTGRLGHRSRYPDTYRGGTVVQQVPLSVLIVKINGPWRDSAKGVAIQPLHIKFNSVTAGRCLVLQR